MRPGGSHRGTLTLTFPAVAPTQTAVAGNNLVRAAPCLGFSETDEHFSPAHFARLLELVAFRLVYSEWTLCRSHAPPLVAHAPSLRTMLTSSPDAINAAADSAMLA